MLAQGSVRPQVPFRALHTVPSPSRLLISEQDHLHFFQVCGDYKMFVFLAVLKMTHLWQPCVPCGAVFVNVYFKQDRFVIGPFLEVRNP